MMKCGIFDGDFHQSLLEERTDGKKNRNNNDEMWDI